MPSGRTSKRMDATAVQVSSQGRQTPARENRAGALQPVRPPTRGSRQNPLRPVFQAAALLWIGLPPPR